MTDDQNPLANLTCLHTLFLYHKQLSEQAAAVAKTVAQIRKLKDACEGRIAALSLPEGTMKTQYVDLGSVELDNSDVYNVQDWDAFYQWVSVDPMNRMPGYLHKKVGTTAMRKRVREGEPLPPGVTQAFKSKIIIKHNGE